MYKAPHTYNCFKPVPIVRHQFKVSKGIAWHEQVGSSVHVYAVWMLFSFACETSLFFLPVHIPLCYIRWN